MTRRSNGEGSFYQQKDKSWVYQITYGRKADGSPYRKSFKGRTKTICKERRAQWEEEQARLKAEEEAQVQEAARLEELRAKLGHPIESEILFSEAFPQWLDLYKAPPARKPSTYASYLPHPLRRSLWQYAALPDHAGRCAGLLSAKAENRRSGRSEERRSVPENHP